MRRNSIKKEIYRIIILVALVPSFMATLFLIYSVYEKEEQIRVLDAKSKDQVRYAMSLFMKQMEAAADLAGQSSELQSFIHSPSGLTQFSANLLNAKISTLADEFPSISSWTVYDATSIPIYSFGNGSSNSKGETEEGFHLEKKSKRVILTKALLFDDQYVSGPGAQVKGYLVLSVSVGRILSRIPNLKEIVRLPKSSNMAGIEVSTSDTLNSNGLMPFLLGLVLFLFICIAIGLYLIKSRVLAPIIYLTQYVARKSISEDVGNEPNELERLKKTFDSYVLHINEAHQKLIRKSKDQALANLARQVVHDIRSPLMALSMLAEKSAGLGEDRRVLLRTAVDRMSKIVSQLSERKSELNLNLNRGSLNVTPLPALISSVVSEKRLQFQDRQDIQVVSSLCEEAYPIFGKINEVEFSRVLSNLINNAIEATHDKGRVEVKLRRNSGRVFIVVSDSGRGIQSDLLDRVTEKGFTKGKSGGSGLGLSHAKECVAAWDGVLTLSSVLGEGTEVIISLPDPGPPKWFLDELVVRPQQNVVVLDDDPSIHEVWKWRFRDLPNDIKLSHFYSFEELGSWFRGCSESERAKALFLLDYDIVGAQTSGLAWAVDLGICEQTVLVTSMYDDSEVIHRCERKGVLVLPKNLAPIVPISMPIETIRNGVPELQPQTL